MPVGWAMLTRSPPGHDNNVVLHRAGRVTGWGNNEDDQTMVPAGLTDVTGESRADHTLVLHPRPPARVDLQQNSYAVTSAMGHLGGGNATVEPE
jgi:hypothetical protein